MIATPERTNRIRLLKSRYSLLHDLHANRGWTLEQLAERCGCPKQTIAYVLHEIEVKGIGRIEREIEAAIECQPLGPGAELPPGFTAVEEREPPFDHELDLHIPRAGVVIGVLCRHDMKFYAAADG